MKITFIVCCWSILNFVCFASLACPLDASRNNAEKTSKKTVVWIDNYGAKGDGVTDDTKVFSKVISMLTQGGVIVLGNKTYLASIVINNPNITMIGSGLRSTLVPTSNISILVSAPNVTLKNLNVKGDGKDTYGVVVLVRGKDCVIDSCNISHGKAGIDTENNNNPYVSQNLEVRNCYIHDFNGFGIHVRNRRFDTIYKANAIIFNNRIDSCSGAINFDCISDVMVDSNIIENTIKTSAINNQDRPVGIRDIVIKDNVIKNGLPATGNSIELQHVDGILIINNKLLEGGYRDGIQIDYSISRTFKHDTLTSNYNKNIIIKGNEIIFRGDYHKSVSLAAIKLNNCNMVSVLNNKVGYYNGIFKSDIDNGIVLYTCRNIIVCNNIINGKNLAGKASLFSGILLGHESSSIFLHNNFISNTNNKIKQDSQTYLVLDDKSKFYLVEAAKSLSIGNTSYRNGDILINLAPERDGPIGWKVANNRVNPIGNPISTHLEISR